jgi:hypothetical protein
MPSGNIAIFQARCVQRLRKCAKGEANRFYFLTELNKDRSKQFNKERVY